ncbi:enoyl-CoA hydratase/isomerase family protein [Ottowia caeni]|uniref:enoyl-CoA hydratase/isomerase family protein n=1 Tax=Ottowia caeni TaxID=2870339 RepID=UPI001E441468|nr:enoyl-CoA hydratase/isomerase family protein [Ottowia caeni]
MSDDTPRFSARDGIATITLSRPAHRNRLHNEDLQALMNVFERVNADCSIRVLVLTSEVTPERPVFSAGYNANEFSDDRPTLSFSAVVDALERVRCVTVCALNGSVYGGATDFALACDIAIGVEGMEMRMPAAALGLHYYPSGLVRYVSRLGVSFSKYAFLTAKPMDAATLLRIGYLQEVVPADAFEDRVRELSVQIASLAPMALESLKLSLTELARGEGSIEQLEARQRATMASEDFLEGRNAFKHRRTPVWKGN